MTDELNTHLTAGPTACPFVAFEEDRDHRSSGPDHRHRCFAAAEPEPRAFPHQERYCLSAAFPQCPIFLDWARQEAAGVKQPSAASATGTRVDLEEGGAALGVAGEEEGTPAFLAGRSLTGPAASASTSRSTEAAASLWSNDGDTKRSSSPSAPVAPSSRAAPAVAMARRGPSHPGWENPPRVENFPRLRSRDDRRANQPLLLVAVAISLFFVALIALPIILSQKGTTGVIGSGATPIPSGAVQTDASANPSASQPATPVPSGACPGQIHPVKSGESLALIASSNGLQLWEMIAANPSLAPRPDHLEIGWRLCVPPAGFEPTPLPSAS
ncbi:MAG: LysM peptidoglycan-binding domain-containing protein [Candidatus Limnocylindrales bacterium]